MSWYLSVFWIVILSFTLTSFFLFKFMQLNALKTLCMNAMRSSQKHKYSFFEFTCTIFRLTSGLALYRKKDSSYPWFVGLIIYVITGNLITNTLFLILKIQHKIFLKKFRFLVERPCIVLIILNISKCIKYFLFRYTIDVLCFKLVIIRSKIPT